jgi:hypothetical protein
VFRDDADLYQEGSVERLEASLMKVENLVAIEQLNECVAVCRQPVVIAELMFK